MSVCGYVPVEIREAYQLRRHHENENENEIENIKQLNGRLLIDVPVLLR